MKTSYRKVVLLVIFTLIGIDLSSSYSVNTNILQENTVQNTSISVNSTEDGTTTILNFKNDVESIQPSDMSTDSDELEESYHRASINFQTNLFTSEDIEVHSGKSLETHHLALIIGAVLLVACVGIYAVLITWRHYLEKRYGMMEQLVTEDAYFSNDHVRNGQF